MSQRKRKRKKRKVEEAPSPATIGEIVNQAIIERGASHNDVADGVGSSRQTIFEIVHNRRKLSFDMALRLEKSLGVSAKRLLRIQLDTELAEKQIELEKELAGIKRLRRKPAT